MELNSLLLQMKAIEASDLYLSVGAPPAMKIHGHIKHLEYPALLKEELQALAYNLLDEEQKHKLKENLELNFATAINADNRFRVNIFFQRNEVAMVIRRIQTEIPSLESLNLPSVLKDLIMEKRGLILFVGATGCGKSTSLAALINYRNENSASHIISIEDPIEFIHRHKKSIVNQREVGLDTLSYRNALKNTLRQSPDVILIGEIRSRNTMEQAINFAETGHLCLATLHANNTDQAFDRIINFFPQERRNQLLLDLSMNIRAIISQRLIPTIEEKSTVAVEVLLGTPLILSLIHRGEFESIKEVIEKSTYQGMQTFDQSLEKLFLSGKIRLDDALQNADSKNNLRLKISLGEKSQVLEEEQSCLQPQTRLPPLSKEELQDPGLSLKPNR